jgi:hypothetical protein
MEDRVEQVTCSSVSEFQTEIELGIRHRVSVSTCKWLKSVSDLCRKVLYIYGLPVVLVQTVHVSCPCDAVLFTKLLATIDTATLFALPMFATSHRIQ